VGRNVRKFDEEKLKIIGEVGQRGKKHLGE
jgi:hypothetical protein